MLRTGTESSPSLLLAVLWSKLIFNPMSKPYSGGNNRIIVHFMIQAPKLAETFLRMSRIGKPRLPRKIS